MKAVLARIEQKKQECIQLPLFQFIQDKSIAPRQRLAFTPCLTPFVMSFADLIKYVLRQEPTEDKIQKIINQHTYEDDYHWQWFLEDMKALGFSCSLELNDSLKFLWSEETKASRLLIYQLYHYFVKSEPIQKLVILEIVEGFADVFFSITVEIAKELMVTTNKEYPYFGHCHLQAEATHNAHTDDVRQFLESIQLDEPTRQECLVLVDKISELFAEWTTELVAYAKTHQRSQPYYPRTQKSDSSQQAA